MEKQFEQLTTHIKSVDADSRVVSITASTPSIDRHGDIIDQKGWKLDKFKENPVILADHDMSVEKVIGRALPETVKVGDSGNLEMDVKFSNATELSRGVFAMVADGTIKALSVGFIPLDAENVEVNAGGGKKAIVRKFTSSELYEVSFVAVGANAQALVKSAWEKVGKGLTTEEAKAVQDWVGMDDSTYDLNQPGANGVCLGGTSCDSVEGSKGFGIGQKSISVESIEKISNLLTEKHDVLKAYNKLFSKVCRELGYTPGHDHLNSINEVSELLNKTFEGYSKTLDMVANLPDDDMPGEPEQNFDMAKAIAIAKVKTLYKLKNGN